MTRDRHGAPDTPGQRPDDATAPADLLQMWISGRDAARQAETDTPAATETETTPVTTPETAPEADVEAAPAGDDAPEDAAPEDAAAAEPVAEEAPVDESPTAEPEASSSPREWWPGGASATGPAASRPPAPAFPSQAGPVEDAGPGPERSPSSWWPLAPETAETQETPDASGAADAPGAKPVAESAEVPVETEQTDLHEDVETEWTAADEPDAPAVADAEAAGSPVGEPDAADRAGGWASFGAAQTAEDVLDRLSSGSAWPAQSTSRPPADVGPSATTAPVAAAPVEEPVEEPGQEPVAEEAYADEPDTEQPAADEPFAEDAAADQPWGEEPVDEPVAEDAPAEEPVDEPVAEEAPAEEPVADPEPEAPAALDVSATTHWSLDDFESYIRQQGGTEPAEPAASAPASAPITAPEPAASLPDEPATEPSAADEPAPWAQAAPEPEPADEDPADADPAPGLRAVPDPVVPEPPAVEPTAEPDAWTGSTDPAEPDPGAERWAEPDVEWDDEHDTLTDLPAQPAAPASQEALFDVGGPTPEPQTEPEPDPEATQYFDFVVDEEPQAPTHAAPVPDAAPGPDPAGTDVAAVGGAHAADPEALTPAEPEALTPAEPEELTPAEPEELTPAEPEALTTEEPEALPAEAPEAGTPVEAEAPIAAAATGATGATEATEATPDPAEDDEAGENHQEWFDDHGLRWVSDDGGYTWFSDDGQGWNAEIGEPIEVPADHRPATAAAAPASAPEPEAPQAAPLFRDEVQDAPPAQEWPAPPAEEPAAGDEMWPTTTTGSIPAWRDPDATAAAPPTESMWPAEPPATAPATEASLPAVPAESEQGPTTQAVPAAAASKPAATATYPESAAPEDGEIPAFVEYKPRGAYRPLLGALFVVAAIVAVAAIFWAVSRGDQVAIGVAAGVTGFALAFWWGLLSWTPTIVSLSGSILEVARGSDGERFDLRSPKLMIDVDDDVHSRNWRTTITRPNGTELVIPASAVDPEEFAMIVKHYRAEAGQNR